ncbi:MAG: thioredoxin domain-containing protein [Alphaproteobacteria bacterium]|nr:thioredoxin domain-containing protein [Alphaproteobacteria bacterium]
MLCLSNTLRKTLMSVGAAMVFFSTALAQAQTVPEMPDTLKDLADKGAQVRFLGDDLGLSGWFVFMKGSQQFFYETADKKALISGVLYNDKGELVTSEQLKRLQSDDQDIIDQFTGGIAAEPAAEKTASTSTLPSQSEYETLSPSEQLFVTIEHSNWVSLGDKDAPVVYSFVDPLCPHCHDFVNELRRGFLKRGMVQLRIVPVGLMGADSMKKAAFLLSAPDAADRFYKHLDGDEKALPVENNFNTDGVELNIDIMRGWGLDVTPFSIYRDAAGKVKIIKGMPSRLEEMIGDLP